MGIHADVVANGLRVRGFVGLPDGSAWLVDEVLAGSTEPVAAGRELGGRMLAAGAAELLRDAEAMAARDGRAP